MTLQLTARLRFRLTLGEATRSPNGPIYPPGPPGGSLGRAPEACRLWRGSATVRQANGGKEAAMELKRNLSVLAAIISFVFLAAIVFGIV